MKLEEGKLTLNEDELKLVKKASMFASPDYAGAFLRNALKNASLEEDVDNAHDARYYAECVVAYRKRNYEIV